jgi:NhaP-type Na+/H+ or K+/H+ antiporter
MITLLFFAGALLLAVLVSELADRSVLSTAVLFLVAGFLAKQFGFVPLGGGGIGVGQIAEIALVAVLFTDGMRVGLRDLTSAWHLPGRALLFGLPLTLLGTAVLAHWVAGLPWLPAFLVGAVLSPTDPVFAAAIVGREEIPQPLRHLLNVESGVNDGLALPIVLALLAASGADTEPTSVLLTQVASGVGIGIALPWAAARIERTRFFSVSRSYQPLYALAIGLLVYSTASVTHANQYLAAFAAGVTVATVSPKLRTDFHQFGDALAELLKLGALLIFGALISPHFLASIPFSGYVFALLALVLVRPAALCLSLIGSSLSWPERLTAGWFGPKGFASVVYGLLIVAAAVPLADEMFHLIALVIVGSILAHSSTDVLIARWFGRMETHGKTAALSPNASPRI